MHRKGFTLIEITVVVALIALFAAAIVPNLSSEKAGRERRAFYSGMERLTLNARELAIETKREASVRFDDSINAFFIEQEDEEGVVEEVETRVTLPDSVQIVGFRADGQTVSSGDWNLRFYPDGTSDGGGLSITDNEQPRAIEIDRRGVFATYEGELVESEEERWPAGENEQRA